VKREMKILERIVENYSNVESSRPSLWCNSEEERDARYERIEAQRGIGALEYIGIIAVILVILFGVLGRLGLLTFSSNTLSETSAVSSIATSVRSNLKSGAGYGPVGSDLTASLNGAQGIPPNLNYSGGLLYNTLGTAYALVASNGGFGFSLTDAGLPPSDCAKLVVQQSSSGTWSGGISVGGSSQGVGPITIATAISACSGATNSVIFVSNT
jgi:hypothetical protein